MPVAVLPFIQKQMIQYGMIIYLALDLVDSICNCIMFTAHSCREKAKSDGVILLIFDTIKRYNLENRVIFGAVDHTINKELQKQKLSSIPICADIETMKKISQIYKQGQLDENYPYEDDILGFFLEPHTRSILTEHLINTIHKAGKPLVIVGSLLDDPTIQKEMIEFGVDILFTDRPDVLRQTLILIQNKSKRYIFFNFIENKHEIINYSNKKK